MPLGRGRRRVLGSRAAAFQENFPGGTWWTHRDLAGKRVIVIGSGATAATLVPAIAESAAHVTTVQRSPACFFAPPRRRELAATLESLDVPAGCGRAAYRHMTAGARVPEQVVPVGAAGGREVPGAAGPLRARVYRPEGPGPFTWSRSSTAAAG